MSKLIELETNYLEVDFDPFADGEILLSAPTTESQKEIWLSVQKGTEANLAFNLSYSLLLKGNLDLELLKQSIQTVIQRHETLRINFSKDGNYLFITPSLTIDIPVINLSNFREQENKITQIKKQIAKEPFNLEKDPLFRVQILQLNTQKHLVIFSAHHIICDGWSWWLLINDLGKIYSGLKQGIKPDLEMAESFSEYAISEWEINHQFQNQETEKYWQKQFSDFIPVVSFPPDLPRPKTKTFNSAREDWLFPETLISQLKSFGIKQGCSFMPTFLAGFEVFLYQITKQTDLNIGVSRSGQAFAGKYNLMGYCVNLLPLRTTISPEQSFKTYLKLRNGAILDAFDYQQMNFSSLVEKLQIPVDTSQIPLLPITITVQDIEAENFGFDDLEVECIYENRYFDNCEIDLNLLIMGKKVILQCQYNTNLFSAQNIRDRLAEFEALLTTIIEKPDLPIAQLPLFSESGNQLFKQEIPLSFSQKRLWFLDQLEGANSAYNISMAWQINGNLNIPILEKTIKTIIQRHEILRTNFLNNKDGNSTDNQKILI